MPRTRSARSPDRRTTTCSRGSRRASDSRPWPASRVVPPPRPSWPSRRHRGGGLLGGGPVVRGLGGAPMPGHRVELGKRRGRERKEVVGVRRAALRDEPLGVLEARHCDPEKGIFMDSKRSTASRSRAATSRWRPRAMAKRAAAPHWPQKLSSLSLTALQAAHTLARGAPHLPQNRRPSRFTDPQEAQFMGAKGTWRASVLGGRE